MKKSLEFLSIVALLVWGGVFVWFYTSGRIGSYLDPSFRIFALLAGIGLIVLALFNLMTQNRAAGTCNHEHAHGDVCNHDHHLDHSHGDTCDHDHHDHNHDCEDDQGHEHHHEGTPTSIAFALLVLLVPLLMAARFSQDKFSPGYLIKWAKIESQMQQMKLARDRAKKPASLTDPVVTEEPSTSTVGKVDTPPLSEEAVAKADTPPETASKTEPADESAVKDEQNTGWDEFTLEDLKKMVPQNSKGDFLLDVPQIFYTAGDDELMKVMEGIPVETTAQVMAETTNNPNKTRLRAFRLFIECCAADARPLSIPIEFGKALPKYKEMGWYKISGKLHFSRENDEIVPVLKIDKIVETIEPVDGMMY